MALVTLGLRSSLVSMLSMHVCKCAQGSSGKESVPLAELKQQQLGVYHLKCTVPTDRPVWVPVNATDGFTNMYMHMCVIGTQALHKPSQVSQASHPTALELLSACVFSDFIDWE